MQQPAHLPAHIAIIMDGNGRWAQRQNQSRTFGHAKGVECAREITKECARLGIKALTLYTFSTENWQRPAGEVGFLMKLLMNYLLNEARELMSNQIRFRAIGDIQQLPADIQKEIRKLETESQNNPGMVLNLALSYGSRQEITQAVRQIADAVASGKIAASGISEQMISENLYTAGLPDPDLMIRTGGDHRISNYLLWQNAYSELYFTDTCWPDFNSTELHLALADFANAKDVLVILLLPMKASINEYAKCAG